MASPETLAVAKVPFMMGIIRNALETQEYAVRDAERFGGTRSRILSRLGRTAKMTDSFQ